MRTESLAEYFFSPTHAWLHPVPQDSRVGISDYAQDQMGDMLYLELPEVGQRFQQDQRFGDIESVKATSEVIAPVTCEVVAVNSTLRDHPELVNDDPYGDGWMIQIRILSPEEMSGLLNFVQYKGEVLQEVLHILYLDEANKIHYLPAIRGDDGVIAVDTKLLHDVVTASIISTAKLQKLNIIDEFEYLMNKPNLKEYEFQRFFQEHPEFLLGLEYERLFPQVVLKREDEEELRPDFVLQPLAGVSYEPNIVELKLPNLPVVKPTPRREGLYANVLEAVMQLRGYARYFREAENREYVRKVLGFTAYQPRLTLIIGKSINFADKGVTADILRSIQPIELVTYEDLLRKYKRLVQMS